MAVATAIKDYIANTYCGGTTHFDGVMDFNEDCALNKLRTPLPSGYTHDTICVAEVIDWAYANIGYSASGAPPTNVGYITVDSTPRGAEVVISGTGASCGETPVTMCEVSVGYKTVAITKTGYKLVVKGVMIKAGETANLGTILLTLKAGEPPGGEPPGGEPSGDYVEPTSGAIGYFALCSHPGGATIKIDGAEVSWKAPLCPTFRNLKVSANVSHTIMYSMAGYDHAEIFGVSVSAGTPTDAIQYPGIMSAEIGAHAGYAILKAHDEVSGKVLRARPSISGITLEERHLTPYKTNLSIPSTKNSKDYKFGVTYSGYEKKERTVSVTTSHTPANPLIVDLPMKLARVWKEVEVLSEAALPAWVTGVTVPSPLVWGSRHDIGMKFIFYKKTRYRGHIDLHARPANWDYKLNTLPSRIIRISTAETAQLDPWKEENSYSLSVSWTCPNTIPEGIYVIVAQLDYYTE